MAEFIYTIPDDKLDKAIADWCYLRPNRDRKLKDGINIEDVPEGTDQSDNTYYEDKYTDGEWMREDAKNIVNNILKRSRVRQEQDKLSAVNDGEIQ